MSIEKELIGRSDSKCELCTAPENLAVFEVQPIRDGEFSDAAYLCSICIEQIENKEAIEPNHWRCLSESMWSEVTGVQVLAWRMLNHLRSESWAQNLLDMLYLDEETQQWAEALPKEEDLIKHLDSNGALLEAGDTVILIKDLNVKGASFTAKRGTAVRRISLVADNPEHIEGKINGQHIVILTKFVKKSK